MSVEVQPCGSVEELNDALAVIGHYFGTDQSLDNAERFAQWIEVPRMHAAWEDGRIVGGAGAFSYRMSVPGGAVPCAGVTVVGVLPTHRRRGVLTAMMRAQLDDAHERGDAVAYLWASEATIYPRFGYGLASRMGEMTLARDRSAFAVPFDQRGRVRLVDFDESVRIFPALYEQAFAQRPGLSSCGRPWWETRRLAVDPAGRQGRPPLNRALLELDGEPAGYALYRVEQDWSSGSSTGSLTVIEAVTPTPEATRELWRWLLDFDWTSKIVADLLPLDHPLFLLLAEPRRMQFQLNDGVWVRLVDVGAALSARSLEGDSEVVLELTDSFCPWNEGRWRVTPGGTERTDADATLRLDSTGLGSVYLGGFGFGDLLRASRVHELRPGAVERADALFHTELLPWCAEIF
jgi:predicted acetyltransferase